MTTAITTTNTIAPAANLQPGLFDDFIAFIDRGEKTTHTYITNLRQFAAWMHYAGITQPTRQDILLYRDYLTSEHDAIQLDPTSPTGWSYRADKTGRRCRATCKPSTVKQYLQSVRQFFSWTAANGYYPNIAANIHAPKVRQDTHKKEALAPSDVLTIEDSIDRSTEQGKRLYAMYVLAVNAGLRTVELARANVRDIEVKNGRAVLYVWGKGHTEPDTKKPLAREVYQAIKDYLDSRTDAPTAASPLFVATGNRSGGQRLATTTISRMLKKAMQNAGYDSGRITAHSLRHSAAQAALQTSGGNIYTAQQYLRHASPATTEIYLHEDDQTERAQEKTAQGIYDLYHGKDAADDKRARLALLIQGMTDAQLDQLTTIAAALVGA